MRPVDSRAAAAEPLSRTHTATLRTDLIRLALQHIGAEQRIMRSNSLALEATASWPMSLHTAASALKEAMKLLPRAIAASQFRHASSKVGAAIPVIYRSSTRKCLFSKCFGGCTSLALRIGGWKCWAGTGAEEESMSCSCAGHAPSEPQ